MSAEAYDARPFVQQPRSTSSGRKFRVTLLLVGVVALGVIGATIAGAQIPSAVFVVAIIVASIILLLFAFGYWFRRTHTPEERAALVAESESRRDRIKFVKGATKYKREVLRTGRESRAVITGIGDVGVGNEFSHLIYLELEVTAPGHASYAVNTGEDVHAGALGSVAVGRELVVRVDLADPQRVAVDWEESLRLRQSP